MISYRSAGDDFTVRCSFFGDNFVQDCNMNETFSVWFVCDETRHGLASLLEMCDYSISPSIMVFIPETSL